MLPPCWDEDAWRASVTCGLGIISTENELFNHLGDTLDAETSVDCCVLVFVLIGDALKMFLEQGLDGVDSSRLIDCLPARGKLKGQLGFHIEQ